MIHKKVSQKITVRIIQHPNGDARVTTQKNIPDYEKILAEKVIEVEFEDIDLGHDHDRSFPDGRMSVK